jgi:asparagine synthase (glutamine-hydrolysing)
MSAIAGIYHLNDEPVNLDHGRRLMKSLEKFPADDVQTWHNDKVFLGCHAQWITPESLGEKLPYYDEQRKLAITADAIIDNRDELFESLQVDRGRRKSITDSELILLAYEKWGEDCPKHLVGDFAFMIWDEREQKMFGARDFSGARTLYYYNDFQRYAFCTVMSPLLSLPYVDKNTNDEWIAEYLVANSMIETIEPYTTIYKNIKQVPPSHSILIRDGNIQSSRFITLPENEKITLKNNSEYEEAFREVFQKAVTSRLRTHHKVGAQLSGGLDSGSVVSFAAKALKEQNKQLYTFSYVPEENFKDWTPKHRFADESPYIQSTVNYVGNIKDYYLDFKGQNSLSEVDHMLDYLEIPYKFFENSLWIKGIYEEAKQLGIGVLLEGARGNYSISWGSAMDYQALLLRKIKWIKFYHELSTYSENIGVSKSRILSVVRRRAFPFIFNLFEHNFSYNQPNFINSELLKETNIIEKLNNYENIFDPYQKLLTGRKVHFNQVMSWSINGVTNTKLSLRYSLVNRDPTNDLRVIKFCLSVPVNQYVQNGLDRALIRRSMKGYLPDNIRLNQRTRGIQGVDVIHRMTPIWENFINELKQISEDEIMSKYLNMNEFKNAVIRAEELPSPKYVYEPEFSILIKGFILYRYLKILLEGR